MVVLVLPGHRGFAPRSPQAGVLEQKLLGVVGRGRPLLRRRRRLGVHATAARARLRRLRALLLALEALLDLLKAVGVLAPPARRLQVAHALGVEEDCLGL